MHRTTTGQYEAHLARLRERRALRAGQEIAGDIASLKKTVTRTGKRLHEFIDAWESLVPQHLVRQTRISAYRAGTVHVAVGSSAALYEVDRLLRDGLEGQLREHVRGTLSRVKLTLGSTTDPDMHAD